MDSESLNLIYGPEDRRQLEELADFYAPAQTRESIVANPEVLAEAEVIFSGWGAPVMNEEFLEAARSCGRSFTAPERLAIAPPTHFGSEGL